MTLLIDLPTLLLHLRQLLRDQPAKNAQINSNISQYVASIIAEIECLSNLTEPTDIFDALQSTLKVYIDDFLTVDKCLPIITHESFQCIFRALVNLDAKIDFDTVFSEKPLYARTVYYRSFDLLSLKIIVDFLTDKCRKELVDHVRHIANFVTGHLNSVSIIATFKKNEIHDQIPTMRLLVDFMNNNMKKIDQRPISKIIEALMVFFWNFSDKTILVPALLETSCHTFCLSWISMNNLPVKAYRSLIITLYNLARHDDGARSLNEMNAISTLKGFKKKFLDENKNSTEEDMIESRLVYSMIIALLTEPKETQGDLDELRPILNQLLEVVVDAGEENDYSSGGFHISEPLVVLMKLCVHDEILRYVLNESPVRGPGGDSQLKYFCELLVRFRGALTSDDYKNQLALVALFNIIWSISFHDEYVPQLRSNTKFLMTVKSLASDEGKNLDEQYVPRHMSSVPKAASGILWHLDENNPGRAARVTAQVAESSAELPARDDVVTNKNIRVMVSYCHADSTFCHQLVDALKIDTRFDVWVDFLFCHSEDLWEEIAEAIEKATVVLFLMSKDYQDSKSCRQEVMYAKDSLKKRFIPIFIQKDFVATGWLGVRIVGPQYIRFGKKSFAKTAKELSELIIEDKSSNASDKKPAEPLKPTEKSTKKPSESPKLPVEFVAASNKPVEEWTREEISQWFIANHVQEDLFNLYGFKTGSALLLYAEFLRTDWQSEYNDVRERLQQKCHATLYRDEFVLFVDALNRLKAMPKPEKNSSRTCSIA